MGTSQAFDFGFPEMASERRSENYVLKPNDFVRKLLATRMLPFKICDIRTSQTCHQNDAIKSNIWLRKLRANGFALTLPSLYLHSEPLKSMTDNNSRAHIL